MGRGFSTDDFEKVPLTWRQLVANPFINYGRPLETLTLAILPNEASVQHAANLLLYLACLWTMWRLCRRMELDEWSTFLALSSFFHPSFLWSVTWINQRNDLLLVLCLLLALSTTRTPIRLLWAIAACASKTPFVLQNLVFSLQFARKRSLTASAVSLVAMGVFAYGGYITNYAFTVRDGTPPVVTAVGTALAVPIGLAKVLEGIVIIFAPVSMFAWSPWAPIAALFAYAACWFVIIRSLPGPGARVEGWIIGLALAMCGPFAFNSEVRVTGGAAVLAFLAVAAAARFHRPARMAGVGILAFNLLGTALNYGLFRSSQYDIRATPDPLDTSYPVYTYQAWRDELRVDVLSRFGVTPPPRR
ncbi:MAG: hypothetical protein A3I61_01485 [Acidobacteria bacterium RIFCSPLOWO2_02_FULL_68_18]|nr:MAG: hypothetical protein A3I61_01485 [Acidobacteria bacterium RIFCSPLOWO2_02_FULL_68_18]OFW51585.1 MAG: hypothetical protein A3G77_18880 [Acidobacteria bacterium RIFCSPLOWO2_12_FULL_68_19]